MKSELTLNHMFYLLLGMIAALWLGPAVLTGMAAPAPAPQGAPIAVAITPAAAGLTLSQSVTLTATVANDSSGKGVTWSVSGSSCSGSTCGTLGSPAAFSATYTAPAVAGVYTVTVISVADNTRLATATIGVTGLTGVYTYRNDSSRSSVNSQEYLLNLSNVNASSFGKLFACTIDQAMYAQPLWIANVAIGGGTHNIVIVATENDTVYAFDADNGNGTACTQYWKASLTSTAYGAASGATPVPASDTGETGDIQTEIGITATPVIDPTTNTLYVLGKTKESGNYFQRLHKLNLSTGAEMTGAPVAITASVPGTGSGSSGGTLTYSALHENPRPGLALVNGSIYIGAGSHGDNEPWHGWILQYNASTLVQTGVYCSTPNTNGGGIWMSGSAPVFDSSNNLYLITSNGTYDGNTEFGDSFLKLATSSGLSLSDWFTPDDAPTLATDNGDLGAGGAVTLMNSVAGPYPDLLIGGGKEGILYLIDRDKMGHFNSANNSAAVQTWQVAPYLGNYGGVSSSGEFWQNTFYIAGAETPLEAFAFNTTTGTFNTTPTSSSNVTYGFPGVTPAISALGTANGIVWGIDTSTNGTNAAPTGPAVLYAFNAANLADELWDSTMGTNNQASTAAKFAVPTIANGKVYVATTNALDVYGLLSQSPAADAPTFSPAPGTYSTGQTVTLSDTTAGATIYYTVDGTAPTTSSSVYSTPISVTATTTINAMAAASGLNNSTVSTGAYTIGSASQTVGYVQVASATPQTASTTVAVTFAKPQAGGDLNVIAIGWNDVTHTVSSVADGAGNKYTLAVGPTLNASGSLSQSIYYAKNIAAASSNTITVTFSGAASYPDVRALEYTNADPNNPLDIAASATGSGASSTVTSPSPTTNANDLIFGANMVTSTTANPGTGFTSRIITTPDSDIAEDRNVGAIGTYTASATISSGQWIMQMAAFKAVSANTTPPTAPSNLSGTAISDNQINLSWTASTDTVGVTGYLIERCQGSGCTSFAQVGTSTTTTYTDQGDLLGGTTFTYQVRATDAAGNLSDYSNVAAATTLADTTPPTAPTNLVTTPASTSQVNLTWTASTDDVGVVGYNVQRCQGASCSSFAQVSSPRTNSVDDTGLSSGTTYSYRVQATDYAGNLSGWSNIATATTLGVPTVSSVSPNSGSTGGGTVVTITGTAFAVGATVTFGSAAATNVVVVNNTTITATTPAASAGTVTVAVTVSGQSGNLANGYTYVVAPSVSGVSPNSGPIAGGTAVTIAGTNFAAGAGVTFGSTAATNVTVVNSTTITATTPAGSVGAGTVTVTVGGQSGSLTNAFTYIGVPTVSSVSPNNGPVAGGTAVTITGTNFAVGAGVMLGSTVAMNVVVTSSTQITATTPGGSAGAVTVTVTNPGAQIGSLASGFTYVVVPAVSSISPNSGPTAGGTSVTITGTNFASGATVMFGTAAATNVAVTNSTTITATTPANPAGAVAVKVTVNGQSGSLANGFTYISSVLIGYTQVAAATPQSPTSAVSATLPAAETAGDLNIVVVGWNDATSTVQSVKDSVGNTYSVAVGPTVGSGLTQSIYYAANIVGGNNTVTVTFNQAAAYPDVRVLEYKGVTTLDAKAGASGSGTAANSGSATTNFTNELIFGADTVGTTTTAAGSGFTSRVVTSPDGDLAEDKIVTTAGTNSAMATLGSGAWVMQMATFYAGATAPAPTVTGVSPNSGSTAGGTSVTITGTNFVSGATVKFGAAAATNVTVTNTTTITATTPASTVGAMTVAVTNPDTQNGSLSSAFTYVAPVPTVSSVSPNSGSTGGGTVVTITGTAFAAGATVTFGSAAATNVVVVNNTTITATTPAASAGTVTVAVTVSGQSGNLANGYTYVVAPSVSGVSPNSGPIAGGTAVTIAGTNFAAGAGVTFGSTAATNVTVVNSTTITATTPAGSVGAGTVTVTVGGQSGSLTNAFTYIGVPTVSSVSPNNGPVAGGTAVTITGTNFAVGAGVMLGSTVAMNVVVTSSTQITATTPGGSAGAVTMTVTNPGAQIGSLASGFTYVVVPAVSSISPNSGPTAGGTSVTITGTNFASGATVMFGTAAATNVAVTNSTTITATTPANPAGAVAVKVTVNGQSGSLANAFTYVVAPTVSGVSPNAGSTAGGTTVTITGTNFVSGATVMFGSAAATSVSVTSSTTITATTPANAVGSVTVTVTNPGGLIGSLGNGFTYSSSLPPTVTSVYPNNGPTTGGTGVRITGTNFVSGATVLFGAAQATNVTVNSSTTIFATTPENAAGAVNVTVSDPGGLSGNLAGTFTYTPVVPISFAQVAAATPQAPAATVSVTYPSTQTLGDMNIVVVGWNDITSTVKSVTDNAGNTYYLAIGPTTGSGLSQSIYYASNVVSGSNTVTVTFNQPAAYPDVRVLEYKGLTTLDAKAGASGSGATANSGTATTTVASELIFGADTISTTTGGAGSGFTSRIVTSPDSDIAEDRIVTVTGSYSATASVQSSGSWAMQLATFYAAGGGILPDTTPPSAPSNLAGPAANIQAVQSYINSTALTTHTTAPFDSTGGDVIVVFASSHAGVTMTPSDSLNNTWISVAGPTNTSTGFDLRSQIWYAKSPIVGPGQTFTLNLSAAQSLVISIFVLKGSNVSNPIDALSAIGDDAGTQSLNVASPNIATTNADDALIGFVKSSVAETFTAGSGYALDSAASSDFLAAENETDVTPGTYNASFSLNTAATWQSTVVAIAPSPTSVTSTGIELSWAPSTDNVGVTGYFVERCQGSGCSNFAQIGTTTSTSYDDTGLSPATVYNYRVRATDGASNLSAYSNVISASTE